MRISEKINEVVERAVARYSQGEPVDHEVTFTVVPLSPGQLGPLMVIMLTLPAAEIGQRMMTMVMAPGLDHDEKSVSDEVGKALEGLRAERSKTLNGAGPKTGLADPRG